MCGIAGIVCPQAGPPPDEQALLRMAHAIRHRGPDGFGLALDPGAGLVSTRLAIFDIPGGWQPLEVADSGGMLVYNGEVYNHPELRAELSGRGEAFATTCDTEVVLRLLERDGLGALDRLNGQFAFAWWQPRRRRLTLVRDRFGVRPLHYALLDDGTIVFGSEAKAIFASGKLEAQPDLQGIDDVFTLWGPRPPPFVA
jgi:asparagine synthase (glutamine-hydrolysing)